MKILIFLSIFCLNIVKRVLKCGHTFCKICLEKAYENNGKYNFIRCKKCGKRTFFPKRFTVERAMKVLIINYAILEICCDYKSRIVAEDCKKEDQIEFHNFNKISRVVKNAENCKSKIKQFLIWGIKKIILLLMILLLFFTILSFPGLVFFIYIFIKIDDKLFNLANNLCKNKFIYFYFRNILFYLLFYLQLYNFY